jgi:hypothetical protein
MKIGRCIECNRPLKLPAGLGRVLSDSIAGWHKRCYLKAQS